MNICTYIGKGSVMGEVLYHRLGGADAIEAVVDEFYDRVLADDRVAHFFDDVDMSQQRAHQTQFISAVAGGPVEYTGKEMEEAHAHLDISHDDFDVIAELLAASLEAFDVADSDQEAVLGAVESYRDDVVTVTA